MIIDPYTWHHVIIASISPAAADTVLVQLTRPKDFMFRAGQYAIVRTEPDGNPLLRQYSFSSSPRDQTLEILVQREKNGVVSNWFCDTAKAGDGVDLSQPFGNFTWNNEPGAVLFIAGRVGIAPFLSMLKYHQTMHSRTPVAILYSVRESQQICDKDLLDQFSTTYVVTGSDGRITRDILQTNLANDPLIYLCGSKRFVDAMAAELEQLEVPDERIKRELFTLQ